MADLIREGESVSQPSEVSGQGITFKKREFIQSLDSGRIERINRHGRRTEEEISEYVTFDEETKESYRKFLENYIHNLIQVQTEDPSLLNTPERKQDKIMIGLLSRTEKNDQGQEILLQDGRPSLEVDEAKIQRLLTTSNGFALANLALETYTSKMMLALSLEISNIPPGQRDVLIHNFTFLNGINQGLFSRFFSGRDTVPERMNALLRGLFDRGKSTVVAPDQAALLSIQNDTEEASFIHKLTGIDVRDFSVNPVTGRVESARGIANTQGVHEKIEIILGNLSTRERFYGALGVPANRLDAIDSQFIYNLNVNGREEISTHVNELLKREFQANVHLQDARGRLPGDRNYSPTPAVVETALREYEKARKNVFINLAQKESAKQIEEPQDISRSVSSISEKLDRINKGEVREKKKEELKKRNEILEIRKKKLIEERELSDYGEQQQAIKDIEDRLTREFGHIRGVDIETTITDKIANITDTVEGRIKGRGGNRAGGLSELLRNKQVEKASFIKDEYSKEITQAVSALKGKKEIPNTVLTSIQNNINVLASNVFDESIERLEKEISRHRETKENLQNLLGDYRRRVQELDQLHRKAVQEGPKELNEMAQVFIDLTSVISFPDLENRTTEDLLIDASAILGFPIGTEEEKDIVRQKIIQAKTEQKGIRAETFEPSPADQLADYQSVMMSSFPGGTGYDITLNDLITRSELDLITNLQDNTGRYRWPATSPVEVERNKDRLKRAIKEAHKKLLIRNQILVNEQIKNIDEQIHTNEKGISETVEDIMNNEGRILLAAQVIVNPDRRDEIFKNCIDIVDNLSKYTDNNIITIGNTEYTEEEQRTGYPSGYFEFMNFMFAYQEDPNREEKFRNINKALPPQKLAKVLNHFFNFGLTVGAGGTDELNIENVLRELDVRPNTTVREIQRALGDVIHQVKRESDAITI